MSHKDILKYVTYIVHGSDPPHSDASGYSVLNTKILEISIKLESIHEEGDTPLVESDN